MAKILVADDNSNIQKMVGLALKDQGIDVVAVGNGEAAVRKISDVRPDLVLADVFMPVRNGYEVCKYVKDDSALAHIPVILLVGAFDPLDEQEAQRVGADGVLKKPFVPPDPLISMVKSALNRAGVAVGPAPAKEEPQFQPLRGTDLLTPPAPKVEAAPEPMPLVDPEPFHEPVSKKAEPLTIDSNSQPLAFGSLLETPAKEEEPLDDSAYVTTNSQMERSWGAKEEEEEVEEEEETSNSWRPSAGGDDGAEPPAGKEDWREKAFKELESIKSSMKWQTPKEKEPEAQPEPAPAAAASTVPTETPFSGPASMRWGNVTSIERTVTETAVKVAETESFVTETPAPPALVDSPIVTESAAIAQPEPQVQEPPPQAAPAPEPAASPSSTAWFSVPSSPWDAEVQKASQLASTWDAPPAPSAPSEPKAEAASETVEEAPAEATSPYAQHDPAFEPQSSAAIEAALPEAAKEEIREEAAQVVEEAVQEVAPAEHAGADPTATSPDLDDVVAKVLSRLSPEALQAVTKEILKPVIESIVREELKK